MKKMLVFLMLNIPFWAQAQTGSEIYLFDLKISKDKIEASNPQNVTNHPGYDNQPSFHSSKPVLYYSSFNEEGRSDIKTYNYGSKKTASLTTTSEREYSPTLTPDGKFISCIIQRDNDAQDLGKYPINGGEAVTLIDNLIVGYHAWVDENNLILFVLGDPMTLQWYNLKTKSSEILENNIGRSLHKIPGQLAMSFVHKKSDDEWVINKLDIKTRNVTPITTTIKNSEDLAWTPDGRILMSDGEKLFVYDPKTGGDWKEVEVSSGDSSISGITRLAISTDGKKLAVVAAE